MNAENNPLSIQHNLIQSFEDSFHVSIIGDYVKYTRMCIHNNANKLELTPGNKTPIALASSPQIYPQYKIKQFIFIIRRQSFLYSVAN